MEYFDRRIVEEARAVYLQRIALFDKKNAVRAILNLTKAMGITIDACDLECNSDLAFAVASVNAFVRGNIASISSVYSHKSFLSAASTVSRAFAKLCGGMVGACEAAENNTSNQFPVADCFEAITEIAVRNGEECRELLQHCKVLAP